MNKQSGFTLIELMVVIVLIGVLSAIAIPAYTAYQIKTDRTDGCKKSLYEIALELEKFHQLNGTYTTTFGTVATSDVNYKLYSNPDDIAGSSYMYSIEAGTTGNIRNSYKISCMKQAASKDDVCGDLTLDNFGREGMDNPVAGSSATAEVCWR